MLKSILKSSLRTSVSPYLSFLDLLLLSFAYRKLKIIKSLKLLSWCFIFNPMTIFRSLLLLIAILLSMSYKAEKEHILDALVGITGKVEKLQIWILLVFILKLPFH